jgi:MoaA/NifB/PqqE/SkfB family radical SAM enzyme
LKNNLKTLIDEVTAHIQSHKTENEQLKRNAQALVQEKEDAIENVKRQFERQKQKDLEVLRDYMMKDQNCILSNTNEINSLVQTLKNKDREIHDIQTNMNQWKQETLEKLAEKFESELNKELDRRMSNCKNESNDQQLQLDKIRKEMDSLVKEYREASVSYFFKVKICKFFIFNLNNKSEIS